jgi:hypothetical protein
MKIPPFLAKFGRKSIIFKVPSRFAVQNRMALKPFSAAVPLKRKRKRKLQVD